MKLEMKNGDLIRGIEVLPDGKIVGYKVILNGCEIIYFRQYLKDAIVIKEFIGTGGREILKTFHDARKFLVNFRKNYNKIKLAILK